MLNNNFLYIIYFIVLFPLFVTKPTIIIHIIINQSLRIKLKLFLKKKTQIMILIMKFILLVNRKNVIYSTIETLNLNLKIRTEDIVIL